MHAPSALVAGAVLTFGAAALANLYLPAGAGRAPRAVAAAPIAQVAASAPPPAAIELPPHTNPELSPFALTLQDSTQQALQSFVANQTAELASSEGAQMPSSEPAVAEVATPEPEQEPPRAARKPVATPSKKKPAQKPTPERRESRPEADGQPAAFSPTTAAAPAIFGEAPPAAARRSEAASISAISAGRAWVRLGDSRTVAVQAGDVLPSFGRIASVGADAVTFENGTVLRIQP